MYIEIMAYGAYFLVGVIINYFCHKRGNGHMLVPLVWPLWLILLALMQFDWWLEDWANK